MYNFDNKDINKARYYATNTKVFIEDLFLKLKAIPEDKINSVKVEINDSMKLQIANSIENLLFTIRYLYDMPNEDVNDILIRISNLDINYIGCMFNIDGNDDRISYLGSIHSNYLANIKTYQDIYDLKDNDKRFFSYVEFANIVNSLIDLSTICFMLMSNGDMNSFFITDSDEYERMVKKYTLS